jgi:hypothetical protein
MNLNGGGRFPCLPTSASLDLSPRSDDALDEDEEEDDDEVVEEEEDEDEVNAFGLISRINDERRQKWR